MIRSTAVSSARPRAATTVFALVAVLLAAAPLPATASADYLNAINEEGDRLETLGKARAERERLQRIEPVAQPAAAKPAATDQAAFERELNTEFPASYALYSLMSPDERAKVYAEYQQSRTRGAARFFPVLNRIIALSTNKR